MFTVKEYKRALTNLRDQMSETHYAILRAQYFAPNQTMTASQLAKAIGCSNFSVVNLQYGKLGRLISTSLNRLPTKRPDGTYQWWRVLSSGISHEVHGFQWTMYTELARALEKLGIVVETEIVYPEEVGEIESLPEGAVRQISVNAYERNGQARSECIAYYGTRCIICKFDFRETYGEVGKGYIHVHHLQPLSEIGQEYEVDPIRDLRPVCPNCHAIIHKRVPPYSINEVQAMLNQ